MVNILDDDFPASLPCIGTECIKLSFGILFFVPSGYAGVWRDSGHGHLEWADAARRVTSVSFGDSEVFLMASASFITVRIMAAKLTKMAEKG